MHVPLFTVPLLLTCPLEPTTGLSKLQYCSPHKIIIFPISTTAFYFTLVMLNLAATKLTALNFLVLLFSFSHDLFTVTVPWLHAPGLLMTTTLPADCGLSAATCWGFVGNEKIWLPPQPYFTLMPFYYNLVSTAALPSPLCFHLLYWFSDILGGIDSEIQGVLTFKV